MMSDWLRANVDRWQKKMRPEAAVILFGTNDLGRLSPAKYTENMKVSVRRILADGTIPLLTTVPPRHGADEQVKEYNRGLHRLAEEFKIPVIDYYREILQRRPNDWDGALDRFRTHRDVYEVPTLISGDGVHPSNPRAFQNDFSRAALDANGYNLRNYLTMRRYAQVIERVFQARRR
jgi:lysophospholipase L1-like esterase